MVKVIVGIKTSNLNNVIKKALQENGYTIVDNVFDLSECIRKVRTLKPQLLIVEYGFSSGSLIEMIEVINSDKICPVIVLANESQKSQMESVIFENDIFNIFLYKPFNKASFISYIDLIIKNYNKMRKLELEIEKLKDSLETRKIVEKAKGILMKELKIDENTAMKKLQKLSMDSKLPLKEIALKILSMNFKK
ncbi:ANTAR domain-containing response regulator [Caldicellulosiruptoraceae bacterium PP1]